MALELRPSCEQCDKELPPGSTEARICSYECTFCATCVADLLHDVCPNCGGGFAPRPIRPAREWRPGVSASRQPPSSKRVHRPRSAETLAELSGVARSVPPHQR